MNRMHVLYNLYIPSVTFSHDAASSCGNYFYYFFHDTINGRVPLFYKACLTLLTRDNYYWRYYVTKLETEDHPPAGKEITRNWT